MNVNEFESVDNLLKEVAGGLPYELAKDELKSTVQIYCDECKQEKDESEFDYVDGQNPKVSVCCECCKKCIGD